MQRHARGDCNPESGQTHNGRIAATEQPLSEISSSPDLAGSEPAAAAATRAVGTDGAHHSIWLAAAYHAAGVDVVINTSGVENPGLAALAAEEGAAFVDISATSASVAALERLNPERPVLVSVGLAPGLTNLLAAAVHDAEPGQIDIALILGAGERHGAAATAWSYGLLGKRFQEPDGQAVRNYTRPRAFDLRGCGRRRLYRTDFPDQHALTRDLAMAVRTSSS